MMRFLLTLAVVLSLPSASTIYGQATYSSIVGTSRDESGAAIEQPTDGSVRLPPVASSSLA
jgi:hypothetical protein